MSAPLPTPYITYGPDETCNLSNCPASDSLYGYRPSLAANAVFIVLFGIAMAIHIVQGIRYRSWAFLFCMYWGCLSEMIGYGGRIVLWENPFSFDGFLIQIICITLAPAFFSAAIYLTLSKIVIYLGTEHARFSPKWFYWIFIPCDCVSLALQAAGGASSSTSSGSNEAGVYTAIAGLSFQVATLTVFVVLALDYAVRFLRSPNKRVVASKFKVFVGFLSLAIICILIRCAYRIDELSDGYNGPLIHEQGTFIGLEGVMIVIAVVALINAHPGPIFGSTTRNEVDAESDGSTAVALPLEK